MNEKGEAKNECECLEREKVSSVRQEERREKVHRRRGVKMEKQTQYFN